MRPSACLLFLLFCAALPAQELTVREGSPTGTAITDNEPVGGLRDFGPIPVATPSLSLYLYFTNNRATDINFGNIIKSGANPTDFYVSVSGFLFTLPPGQTTVFRVAFYRSTPGISTATLNVDHDAAGSGTSPFEINLRAEAVPRPLQVTVGSPSGPVVSHNQSASGTARDFGSQDVNLGPTAPITLVLTNVGSGVINFNPPDMAGISWNQFAVGSTGGVYWLHPGQSASFTVVFDPTSTGFKDAYVRVAHTDTSQPSPYYIPVRGQGTGTPTPTPIAALSRGTDSIAAGATHQLGSSAAGVTIFPMFTINNIGSGDLQLTGSPMVLVTGVYGCNLSFVSTPTSPIAAGGASTFVLAIEPSLHGPYGFDVSISTNSPVSNPYLATIVGSGLVTPTRLTMINQPGTAAAGQPFTMHPLLAITDSAGQVRSDDSSTVVAVSITAGTGTPGAVLSGTTIAVASHGYVTFTNLQIDLPGRAYGLTFTDISGALLPDTSAAFIVAGPAAPPAAPAASPVSASNSSGCALSRSVTPFSCLLLTLFALRLRRRASGSTPFPR